MCVCAPLTVLQCVPLQKVDSEKDHFGTYKCYSYLFSKLCSNLKRQRSENGFLRARHKICRANSLFIFKHNFENTYSNVVGGKQIRNSFVHVSSQKVYYSNLRGLCIHNPYFAFQTPYTESSTSRKVIKAIFSSNSSLPHLILSSKKRTKNHEKFQAL